MFKKHPKGLSTLFNIEMWERIGFFIMSAIYVLYMDKELKFSDSDKGTLYAAFLVIAYLFPLVGGWLGDKVLGQVKTMRIGIIMMGAGYASLALSSIDALSLFYLGLGLVSVGTGIFKVNMSVLVGNLYREKPELRDAGFNIYYMGVNLGGVIGPLLITIIGAITNDFNLSFWTASAGMVFALLFLEKGKKILSTIDSFGKSSEDKQRDQLITDNMDKKEYWQRVTALFVLFVIASLFWLPFYQNGAALTLFADRSTISLNWLRPETYQIFNPAFILLLTTPMLAIFAKLRLKNKEPRTPMKIFIGLLIMSLAMTIMVFASLLGGNADQPVMSPAWLISTYLVITIAEIMISPMGQSYVSKVAPPSIRGVMMGGWFMSTAIGAMSAGIFTKFYSDVPHHQYFMLLAGLAVFASLLVLLFMKKLNRFAK